jgi:hypothetical protein
MRRFFASVAVAGVVVGSATGCGVPSDSRPQAVDATAVPFGLLDTRPAGASPEPSGPAALIYLMDGQVLRPVPRRVPGVNRPAALVRDLLGGPSPSEAAAGLASAVPSRTRLLSLDVFGTTVTLDLSKEFGDVSGRDQVNAVAQLVYTVTQSPRIDSVKLAVDGKPIEVPDGTGSLTLDPVSRADFAALAGVTPSSRPSSGKR